MSYFNNKKQLENFFCHKSYSFALICLKMALKPFPLHEESIDTMALQICQEMKLKLADGRTDRQKDGLKTFPFGSGIHRYHNCTNLSRNEGVVSGRTDRQTNSRTDRHLHR